MEILPGGSCEKLVKACLWPAFFGNMRAAFVDKYRRKWYIINCKMYSFFCVKITGKLLVRRVYINYSIIEVTVAWDLKTK